MTLLTQLLALSFLTLLAAVAWIVTGRADALACLVAGPTAMVFGLVEAK